MIFVFGSNLAGRHGRGAAKSALTYEGAIYGQGVGRQGNSYAIPTKGWKMETLPISEIKNYVDQFIEYARTCPQEQFFVTKVGCGLAGYTPDDIAPLFELAPENCVLPDGWRNWNKQSKTLISDFLDQIVRHIEESFVPKIEEITLGKRQYSNLLHSMSVYNYSVQYSGGLSQTTYITPLRSIEYYNGIKILECGEDNFISFKFKENK